VCTAEYSIHAQALGCLSEVCTVRNLLKNELNRLYLYVFGS
jgi:hypothetical protein